MSNSSRQYVVDNDASGIQDRTDTVRPRSPGEETEQMIEDELTLDDVLEFVFGVGVREREIYSALAASDDRTVQELADELDRHRSSINRGLKELFRKGFVTRRRRILNSGGQVYQYSARSPEHVQSSMVAALEEWTELAQDELDGFVAHATADGGQRARTAAENGQ